MEKRIKMIWIGFQIRSDYFIHGFIYCREAFRAWQYLISYQSQHDHSIRYERNIFFEWYLIPSEWFKDGE